MIEEYRFWSAEKTKFWIRVISLALIVALLVSALYGWILYQEKAADSKVANPQAPAVAPFDANIAGSSNAMSPLSPLPDTTNLN